MLSEKAMNMLDEFNTLTNAIDAEEETPGKFNVFFKKYAREDFRNEHEKEIDFFIIGFATITIEKMKPLCELLSKSHFKYVQEPFYKKYKERIKGKENYCIPPHIIVNKVKEVRKNG